MPFEPVWGVDVARVAALTPHVSVVEAGSPASTDPVYADAGVRKITVGQIQQWIESVGARLGIRAYRLADVPEDHPARTALVRLAGDVVANGAAAYTVDAAFPARAGVNDNASYGAVLWARYEAGLAELVEDVDRILGPVPAGGTDRLLPGLYGEFPEPIFADGIRW